MPALCFGFLVLPVYVLVAESYFKVKGVADVNFSLEIDAGLGHPDCVENVVARINGRHGGPILRVSTGQLVNVTVSNLFTDIVLNVHMHGMLQYMTPWADGTSFISNCKVRPLNEKAYVFRAPDTPGTYFYHGHTGLENFLGVKGALLVDPPPGEDWPSDRRHDVDVALVFDDWWHAPAHGSLVGLESVPFRWPGSPDSIMINGKARRFNCSAAATATTCLDAAETGCGQPEDVSVKTGQRVMLRLINGCSLMQLNFAVEGHSLTVVELDGQAVKPAEVDSIDLHTGQRVAAILDANHSSGSFWISALPRMRSTAGFCRGAALLTYSNSEDPMPSEERLAAVQQRQPDTFDTNFSLEQQRLFEYSGSEQMPSHVDRQLVFLSTQENFANVAQSHYPGTGGGVNGIGEGQDRPEAYCGFEDQALRWAVNRSTFQFPSTPLPHLLYFDLEEKNTLTEDRLFFKVQLGKTYQVVLQNYPACNGACESHPWHLHGHDFWVVGTWPGEFNGTVPEDGSGGNVSFRDTTTLIGASGNYTPDDRQGCGYTVIRFTANNPGAWAFHCHIEFHFAIGMFAVLYYEDMPKPDAHVKICGALTPETFLSLAQKYIDAIDPATTTSGALIVAFTLSSAIFMAT